MEVLIIVVVALLVVGPEQLPDVARTLAKTVRQVRRIVAEVRESVNLDDFERHPPPGPRVNPHADEVPKISDTLDVKGSDHDPVLKSGTDIKHVNLGTTPLPPPHETKPDTPASS
ncbi:MAG: twin-arginine translocase TatA/TatE family subunit [Magnetococcales bacterium]|nr:twin-arginine translocase TatA/TatE family subunit [Magnetococcales bacterium]